MPFSDIYANLKRLSSTIHLYQNLALTLPAYKVVPKPGLHFSICLVSIVYTKKLIYLFNLAGKSVNLAAEAVSLPGISGTNLAIGMN